MDGVKTSLAALTKQPVLFILGGGEAAFVCGCEIQLEDAGFDSSKLLGIWRMQEMVLTGGTPRTGTEA